MSNLGTVFTKADTDVGSVKLLVLERGQGIISKLNLGDWKEIRMGLMFGLTSLESLDDQNTSLNNTMSISHEDPGTFWSFGLKDDNRGQLVTEEEASVKFLGIHSFGPQDEGTHITALRMRNGFTGGGDSRQSFGMFAAGNNFCMAYMAKNAGTIHKQTSSFAALEGGPNFPGIPGREVTGPDKMANLLALRMRKIKGGKIRIWLGKTSGHQSEDDVRLSRLKFYLDNFMNVAYQQADVIDIDDPFIENNDYPDSFYFYPSNVFPIRWRIGSFMARKYNIED